MGSECKIWIELGRAKASYAPGDTVRGEICVKVDRDYQSCTLILERGWYTDGQSNEEDGLYTDQIFAGSWVTGRTYRYPFQFEISELDPVCYQGHYLNIGWRARAAAKVQGLTVAAADEELLVERPADSQLVLDAVPNFPDHGRPTYLLGSVAVALAVLLLAIAAIRIVPDFVRADPVKVVFDEWIWLALGALGVCIGIGGFVLLRVAIAHRVLGQVKLDLTPNGDRVDCTLHVERALKRLESVTVCLVQHERVIDTSSTNAYRYQKETQRIPCLLHPDATNDHRFVGSLFLPEHAAQLKCRNASLSWFLETHVAIRGRPDWQERIPANLHVSRAS